MDLFGWCGVLYSMQSTFRILFPFLYAPTGKHLICMVMAMMVMMVLMFVMMFMMIVASTSTMFIMLVFIMVYFYFVQ